MKRLVLTAAARRDLREIEGYTLNKWGEGQRLTYMDMLRGRLRGLAVDDALGSYGVEGLPKLKRLRAERHVIFFEPHDEVITVIRVLHVSMDHRRHLT